MKMDWQIKKRFSSETLPEAKQSGAFLYERDFVTVDDLKKLAIPVLAHRVILEKQSQYSGLNSASIACRERLGGLLKHYFRQAA